MAATSSRVNLGPYRSDVSVVWDLGPHDFSILRYWLGETPSHVSALSRGFVSAPTASSRGVERTMSANSSMHVGAAIIRVR